MRPYEFMRSYHPDLGKFVHKHKGSGIIVGNIFKPRRRILSFGVNKLAKQLGKKALKSDISHAGERAGKKIAEKSGDLIMKKLGNMRIGNTRQKVVTPQIERRQQEESTDAIISRLISGSGVKRRRGVKIM